MQDAEGESFAEVPWWLERNTKNKFTNCALCNDDSSLPPERFDSHGGYTSTEYRYANDSSTDEDGYNSGG
jgi:hypothetical protein